MGNYYHWELTNGVIMGFKGLGRDTGKMLLIF